MSSTTETKMKPAVSYVLTVVAIIVQYCEADSENSITQIIQTTMPAILNVKNRTVTPQSTTKAGERTTQIILTTIPIISNGNSNTVTTISHTAIQSKLTTMSGSSTRPIGLTSSIVFLQPTIKPGNSTTNLILRTMSAMSSENSITFTQHPTIKSGNSNTKITLRTISATSRGNSSTITPHPTTKSDPNEGMWKTKTIIIVAVVGGAIVIGVLTAACCLCCRKKRNMFMEPAVCIDNPTFALENSSNDMYCDRKQSNLSRNASIFHLSDKAKPTFETFASNKVPN